MAGLEGLVTPGATEGSKSVDGKKVSTDGVSTPKEGPSLFDSMMAQVSSKGSISTEGEAEGSSLNQKQTTPTATKGTGENGEVKQAVPANSQGGTSLFDKMVTGVKENQTVTTPTQTSPNNKVATTQNNVATTQTGMTTAAQDTQANISVASKNSADTNIINSNTEKSVDTPSAQIKKTSSEQTQVATTEAPKVGRHKSIKQAKVVADETQTQTTPQANIKQNSIVNKNTTENSQNVSSSNISNISKTIDNNSIADTSSKPEESNTQSLNKQTQKEKTVGMATGAVAAVKGLEKETNTDNLDVKSSSKDITVVKAETQSQVKTNTSPTVTPTKTTVTNNTNSSEPTVSQTVNKNNGNTATSNTNIATKTTQNVENLNPNTIAQGNKQPSLVSSKVENNSVDDGVKKSLADNLISTATATALASKGLEESSDGVENKLVNNTKQTQTTAIPQNNTPVNLSSGDTTGVAVQNTVNSSSPSDIKTIEQNVVDKKVEAKNIDIKTSDQKQQILKSEEDQTLKAASTVGTLAKTASSSTTSTIPTNEELASGLASIRETAKGEITTLSSDNTKTAHLKENVKKEETLLGEKKQQNQNSLLDKMIKDASSSASSEKAVGSESLGAKDQFVQKDLPLFATAGYLHDQKKRNDIANMMKKNEGVLQAQNAKSVSDVKTSAQTLGLNATETEVIEEVVQKEEVRLQNTRDDMLKRMAFDNHVGKKLHNTTHQVKTNENIVAKATEMTNTTEEKVVEVAVSAEATQTIENRIIGARQSLRTMMSDVARQMAQNYRPPLTAFRINLNPSGLGNIAVMIKSEQSNGISISLNMSNTNTLETFVDNQSQLRAALTRNFDTNTNFNLDFGMQQDTNSNQNQNNESNQNSNSSNSSTQNEANLVAEQHTTEEVISQANYM